jgi:RHS repeat-associated protein
VTGTTTNGSTTITGLSGTGGLAVGMGVGGTGVPVGAAVAGIVSSSSVMLSVAATASGTVALTFSLFSTTQTAYDAVGNALEVIDPLGHVTQMVYDALNRATMTIYPDVTAVSKAYTPASLVTTETDQAGSVTTHRYDAAARHIAIYQPDPVTGTKTVNSPLTQKGYDPVGNLTSVINPLGNEWTYVYDSRNRKVEEIDPAVANAEVSGSPMAHPTVLTGYDGVGNATSKTDPRGYVTTLGYDNANRLVEAIYPAVPVYGSGSPVAATTVTGYDRNGNVLTVTDEDGNETVNTYDALNRLLTTTTAPEPGTPSANIEEQFAYDPVGNRTQVTDGNGLATTFGYDGMNRLLLTQYDPGTPAATAVSETYDALNKVTRTDGEERVTQYTYDTLNRLTGVVYPATLIDSLHYDRDAVGNILLVVHPNEPGSLRDVVYTYDRLNRQLSEDSTNTTQTHSYDKAGNRLTTIYGGTNRSLAYGYDALNRETALTDSTSSLSTSYAYDLSSNIVQKNLGNGTKEVRTHDGRNRVSTLDNQTGGSVDVAGYAYQYDRAGNVMQVVEDYPLGDLPGRTVTNGYDGVYRLLNEEIVTTGVGTVTTAYGYDQGHNRLVKEVTGGSDAGTTTYEIGNGYNGGGANQVLSAATDASTIFYGYDSNGNRAYQEVPGGGSSSSSSSSSASGGGGTVTYQYDNENRLIEVEIPSDLPEPGTYAYAYDYRTRRVQRTEPGPVATHIVFDGGVSILEYGAAGATSPSVEYVRGHDYGGGVGGLEYSVRSGAPSFNFYDSRGDVTTQTDATGAVTYQAAYEAFGHQVATTGSTLDRQKANTKEQDPTGLLNEGFRYRDPLTGTFLSRDPLGFKAGPNMYTYVRQNPWTHFDPEGLDNNPPPPPPPPPPTQHAPPPKQTVQAPPPPHPPGPPGIDPAATVTSPKPVSSPPAASAKSTDPAKGGESNKPNTEAAGQVSDVAGGATEIGKASNLKVMSNVTSGALSTYTTNFYGNKSVAMLANVGKASDVAGKILKPLAVASFAAGVVGDVKAVKSGQESVPLALAKTGWGAAGFASPHVAAAQAGWAVGQMIANHPMGNGMTVGEQAGQGMYRVAPGLFNYLVR